MSTAIYRKEAVASNSRLKNASFVRIILMLLFLPFKATEWVEAAIGEKSITLDKNEEKVTVAQGENALA